MKPFISVARWRLVLLTILMIGPFVVLVGYAFWQLWVTGWWMVAFWPMILSLALGSFLAWRWQATKKLLTVDLDVPMHWTKRDEQAWELVKARVEAAKQLDQNKLADVHFYVDTAKDMALELARFYNPKTTDPISSLTIPEILAVVELASHDLAEMTEQYLPGGHLLTVRDWQRARKLADWYETATNVYWAVSAVISPFNTAMRYLATKVGMSTPLQLLQQNLVLWFYTAYLHRLGTYLIEVNSGRLRVGAERYRQWMKAADGPQQSASGYPVTEVPESADGMPLPPVAILIMGQVKAGKSSLINALLGEQMAKTNVLPETQTITRYELKPEESAAALQVLDSVGYGHEGPRADQLYQTQKTAQESDLLILVLHALTPARQADVEMVRKLHEWFDANPALKLPPLLVVLTHIDLLSPKMEWQPPYDWQKPKRPKEKNIAEAITHVREQFGERITAIIPVCVAEDRVWGIEEYLLPAVTRLLDQGRAVSLLRCLRDEADARKIRKVFEQLFAAGKTVVKGLLEQQ